MTVLTLPRRSAMLILAGLLPCCSSQAPDDTESPMLGTMNGSGGVAAPGSGGTNFTADENGSGGGSTGGALKDFSGGAPGGENSAGGGSAGGGSADGGSSAGGASTGGAGPAAGGNASSGSGGTNAAGGSGAQLSPITVWIAGDSTVAGGNTPCPRGWGAEIGAYFNEQVTITNRAVGGRSVRTWLYDVQDTKDGDGECILATDGTGQPTVQARWTEMLDGMQAGDYLLIQFGINDGDPNCPRHVGAEAFQDGYALMAQAAQDRGAHPIFFTPVSAIRCSGATAVGTRGFLTETKMVGEAVGVPVVDLHALSVELYNDLGFCPLPGGASDVDASTSGEVGTFFCDDHTHFDTEGAGHIARIIVAGLIEMGIGLGDYAEQP